MFLSPCFVLLVSLSLCFQGLAFGFDDAPEIPAAPGTSDEVEYAQTESKPSVAKFSVNQNRQHIKAAALSSKRIRDFGAEDQVCFYGDLRHHHPSCKCCGSWAVMKYGITCKVSLDVDCSEDYKNNHYRIAYWAQRSGRSDGI